MAMKGASTFDLVSQVRLIVTTEAKNVLGDDDG
ncbi:predicted protein [Sclerotinia sclerotiorum 1980 UF-70]|uniref:Uncharacterized protein n=1 Tax=Sclerotinia sclerotiorum (strain ATCC 18683 / 1980 / Ss-1) TaxID=665079 RepID=A7EDM9_SCLS1|nr:predicted protein [Sclerotinia sclerotiorum 1980 UF-70]EDO00945.1 predicted protein [Sclerotinia sclerotiorum 1980 UF-70]